MAPSRPIAIPNGSESTFGEPSPASVLTCACQLNGVGLMREQLRIRAVVARRTMNKRMRMSLRIHPQITPITQIQDLTNEISWLESWSNTLFLIGESAESTDLEVST